MERSRILDEFAAVTGYHRKHAIRLLSGWGDRETDEEQTADTDQAGSGRRRYGPEVRDALIQLWEIADRVCSKRLQPMAVHVSCFPFPLRRVDFDNDSLFMNDLVVGWCRAEGLEVTRSRAYRKNDQAWVEQKNGAIVRRLVVWPV